MIHHTVPEMKSSDDFAIEYGTDWAELNHIYTRLVSYTNTFAGTNPKTQVLPQVLELIIMTNVRRVAAIKAGGERIMQAQKEQVKQRVKDEPIARARLDAAHQCIPAGGPSKHRLTLIITGALAVQSVATRHTGPCSGTGVWHVPPPPFAVLLPILLPVQLLSCALPIPWPIHFSANFRGSPHPRTHTAPGSAVELISCTTAQHKSLCAHPRMWLCTCTTLRACPCTFLCTHARTCLYVRAGGRACACARMRA